MLVPNNKYSNAAFEISIYDRVGKYLKREDSSSSRCWRPEARMLYQELRNPLELNEEAPGDDYLGLLGVEIQSVGDILLGPRM